MDSIAWMAWTLRPRSFSHCWRRRSRHDLARRRLFGSRALGILADSTTRGDRLFVSLILAALIHLLWIASRHRHDRDCRSVRKDLNCRACGSHVISLVTAVIIFRTV